MKSKQITLILCLLAFLSIGLSAFGQLNVQVYSSGTNKGKILNVPNLWTANADDIAVSLSGDFVPASRMLGTGTLTVNGSGTAAILGGAGGSFVSTRSGTGAVSRSVQDRIDETFNVVDFGAVPNDSGNDSAAIQSAVNALSHAVTNEAVTLPTWLLVDTMNSPVSGTGTYTWTATNGATLSEQTGFRGNCLQISSGTTTLPGAVISSVSAINASSYSHLDMMIYAERAGKVRVTLGDGTNSNYYLAQARKANEWQHVRVRLTDYVTGSSDAAPAANLAAITTIAIQDFVASPPSGRILKIDEFGFSNEVKLAHPMVHPALTSVSGSVDGTDFQVDYPTGKFIPYLGGNLSSGGAINVSYTWGGGKVTFPAGNYNLGTTIDVPSWMTLEIPAGVKLTSTGTLTTDYMFKTDGAHRRGYITFTGGGILDGRRSTNNSKTTRLRAVQLNNSQDVEVSGLTMMDFNDWAISVVGTGTNRSERVNVHDVNLVRCGGIYVDDDSTKYGPLRSDTYAEAAYFEYVDWLSFRDSTIREANGDSFLLKACRWGDVNNLVITRPTMGGYFLIACEGISSSGGIIDGAGSRGVSIDGNSNHNTFSGWSVIGSGREAVWISAASTDNVITGCNLYEAGYTQMPNGTVTAPGAIIRISEASHRNLISNNHIYASANYRGKAIQIDGGTGNVVANNLVFGNPSTTALFSDAGSNTVWFQPNYQVPVQVIGMPPQLAPQTWERFAVVGNGIIGSSVESYSGTATDSAIQSLFRARGTSQVPAAVQDGDRIGMVVSEVWSNSARRILAAERHNVLAGAGTSTPAGQVIMETTGTSSATRIPRVTMDLNGVRNFLPSAAPADATLNNSESVLYFSGTTLRVKWKDGSGTVTDAAINITP